MTMPQPTKRPDPTPTATSEPFWAGTAEHQLRLQRCTSCERAVFYPRERCPHCWSDALAWQTASGRGVVASCTVAHRPGHPAFAEDAPYVIALVDLEEGPRMLSNVVGCPVDQVRIGMAVTVTWTTRGDFTLPQFTPTSSVEGR